MPTPSSPPLVFDSLDAALDQALDNMYDFLSIPESGGQGPAKPLSGDRADSAALDSEQPRPVAGPDEASTSRSSSPLEANDFRGWAEIRRAAIARGVAMKDALQDVLDSVSDEIQRQSSDKDRSQALKDWRVILGVLAVGQLVALLLRRRF